MVLIAVHGSAARLLPAERGTVHLSLGWEADDRAVALRTVTDAHARAVRDAKSLVHRGVATWWGSDQVRVRAERRYVKDEDWRTVQVARAQVKVKFRDFSALSDWVDDIGSVAGTAIDGIDWTITEGHRREVEREVRVRAVQDATARAEAYATAIGGGAVRLERLWEPGLRPSSIGSAEGGVVTRAMMKAAGSGGIELRPDDIEVSAEVTADFEVDPAG